MHVALQTARNQASLETPLKVEELMTTHFNLVVLANELDSDKTTDAQNPEANTLPTCRREYGHVNGIPAGYKTDDSWDNDSHPHEHTHNIVPLLTLHPWNNCPHRGHEQHQRQTNNTPVQTGNAPYSRPWDNQPYGRCTCSQQALRARAY